MIDTDTLMCKANDYGKGVVTPGYPKLEALESEYIYKTGILARNMDTFTHWEKSIWAQCLGGKFMDNTETYFHHSGILMVC